MIRTLLAASALAFIAAPALAQDFSQEPTYGYLNLNTGYVPDPAVIPLESGGDIDASTIQGGACNGYISNAPDFRVNYTAGTDFPLIISVLSDADTTLVVNAADGSWACNDDTDGLNPAVTFANPTSGQYDIWVGTYGEAAVYPAGLYISEITTGAAAMGAMGEEDHEH